MLLNSRRDLPQLSAVGDDVEQPVGPLSHVADAFTPVGEQVLFSNYSIVLDDQPHELRPTQRADEQVALPFGEGITRVELGARGRDHRVPEVDRLFHSFTLCWPTLGGATLPGE